MTEPTMWDKAAQEAAEGSAGGDFLRLKGGDSALLAVLGVPHTYKKVWNPGEAAKPRVMVNVFVLEGPGGMKNVRKILDLAASTFADLYKVQREWDLARWPIRISREGSGPNDTQWSVLPAGPKSQFSDKQAAFLANRVELFDLVKIANRPAAAPRQQQPAHAPPAMRPVQGQTAPNGSFAGQYQQPAATADNTPFGGEDSRVPDAAPGRHPDDDSGFISPEDDLPFDRIRGSCF